jgi:predicted Zn-dependent protease
VRRASWREAIAGRAGRAGDVCAAVVVALLALALPAESRGQAVGPTVLQRPAFGFSLSVPSGWREHVDPEIAAAITPSGREDVAFMVFTRQEDAPVDVEATLSRILTKMVEDQKRTVVSRRFDTFQKRQALVAEFDDDSSRFFITLCGRDAGAKSQLFYIIMAIAPKKDAALLTPAFESLRAGFQLTALTPAPSAQGGGLGNQATTPSQPAKPVATMSAAKRAEIIDRALEPRSTETASAALKTTKVKDRVDGIAAYDRGLVFSQQGAWVEAEKEFHTTEHKDENDIEFEFALGFVYLKLHRPDDALKRFERIYKADPRNTRALVGMAAAYEDRQNYREAVRMWQRYTRMVPTLTEKADGTALLASAQDQFARYYEIAENPGGGAANALTAQQELQLGQNYVTQMSQSGLDALKDDTVDGYIRSLCQTLVSHSKNFPTNYQVFVLDTADVNAFTIPGFIFINRGLLSVVETEAELAGVIAHEIGHSVAHHSAKKLTQQALDQQQASSLKNSNNRFLRWLGSVSESGAASGQAAFSREAEDQADRLAVHITFDSGIDPRGFASFFQKLESISPSSRNRWDLMQRTHPFSIDRLNAINAYVDLLPPRQTKQSSPEFTRMRTRLASLPPPSDATGMLRSGDDAPASRPSSGGRMSDGSATRTFTLDAVPFGGEIPADWGGRKTEAGTIVFEGPEGSESYEVSLELGFEPKRSGLSIDDVAERVQSVLGRKSQARVQATERQRANDGTPIRFVRGTYAVRGNQGGPVPMRHVTVLFDYPGYYVLMSYYTPDSIYDKYQDVFTMFAERFRYTGR